MSDRAYVKELQDYVDRMILSVSMGRILECNIKSVNKKIRSTQALIDLYEKIGITTKRKIN